MKYMLFAWYDYEARGGMNDFIKWADSVDELEDYFNKQSNEWFYENGQIVNATPLQVEKTLEK